MMTRVCKNQEVIKFTARVLHNSYMSYINNAFLLIIETEHPHLKGKLNSNFMEEERYDELIKTKKEWIKPVAGIITILQRTISGLLELFELDATMIFLDDSLGTACNRFFYDYVGDIYLVDIKHYNLTLWKSSLEQYALAVVGLMNLCSELIYNRGEVNSEKKLSDYLANHQYTDFNHLEFKNQIAFGVLQDVNIKIKKLHQDIVKGNFPN
jgi:hypothetical protein